MKLPVPKICLLLIIVFTFLNTGLFAQSSVKGKWYGVGNVNIDGSSNSYLCEFLLVQNEGTVTGYFNYFFRDGYFSNKISGYYDSKKRLFRVKPIPILYHRTVNAGNGVDCIMTGYFTLIVSKAETTLKGAFESDEQHKYTAPSINVQFRKLLKDEPSLKERVAQKALVLEEDKPVEKKVAPLVQKPVETPQQKIVREAERQVQMRAKDVVRVLDITDDSVRVDLYDNGELDYDSVSVFYNNKLLEYKRMLDTKTPISFYVKVDSLEANNDLTMFAENLGLIPPNSAIMILTDKDHRYEIPLTSTYQKNAAVRLRKVKPPVKVGN